MKKISEKNERNFDKMRGSTRRRHINEEPMGKKVTKTESKIYVICICFMKAEGKTNGHATHLEMDTLK